MIHSTLSGSYSSLGEPDKEKIKSVQKQVDTLLHYERGGISDGYHTFDELYTFRKVFNAALFNEWAKQGKYFVHKSLKHFDGNYCFDSDGKWFIVVAMLPTGQISNHYEITDWDLFKIPTKETALFEFDGHTSQDVVDRLIFLT